MKNSVCKLCVALFCIAFALVSCGENSNPEATEKRYLASVSPEVVLYEQGEDGLFVGRDTVVRGEEVTAYVNRHVSSEGVDYVKVLHGGESRYAVADNLAVSADDVVREKRVWVRTPATIIGDLERSTIAGFADKSSELAVLDYDEIDERGVVKTYRVRYGDVEGYVYGKYVVSSAEAAALRYMSEVYDPIHEQAKDRFGGGVATGCDYYPVEKPRFEDNVMPEACYSLYINAGGNALRNIDKYIELAKQSKINTFVIDIKDNQTPGYKAAAMELYSPTNYRRAPDQEELYRDVVKRLHDEGFYVVGRITCFKDSYFVEDNPQCAITERATGRPFKHNKAYWPSGFDRRVWEFNVALAKESVEKFGFNEINFDYVRFPDRMTSIEQLVDYHNRYGESKVQAIQRFVQYAVDEIHKLGAYVSIDVFGETANSGYTTAYGQYWPAISNVADVICGMPYPDHFSAGYYGLSKPWNSPYEIMYRWGTRVQDRQRATPTPAVVRTWIQAYNVMRYVDPNGIAYDSENVEREIRGLYAADLTGGFITWLASSNLEKYYQQLGAYKVDYLDEWRRGEVSIDAEE